VAVSRSALAPGPFVLALAGCLLFAGASRAAEEVDPAQSNIGFTLTTRWGQRLDGEFPAYRGRIEALPDGRRRVRLALAARRVTIVGHPSYSRLTRGAGFFDADQFPEVIFVSEPYGARLTRDGGTLMGRLRIRNVERTEAFIIEPAECDQPGVHCDVVARGNVRRSDYGVDRWAFAIDDQVRFTLRIRLRADVS
jgi:polyisoprenoid-binding protein YceI